MTGASAIAKNPLSFLVSRRDHDGMAAWPDDLWDLAVAWHRGMSWHLFAERTPQPAAKADCSMAVRKRDEDAGGDARHYDRIAHLSCCRTYIAAYGETRVSARSFAFINEV